MSLSACAEIVRRGDPDRFLAVMAAKPSARAVLFPIYAFNVEVARAPWVTQEALIAEMRLQWWRDALAEIAAGGMVRRHDVVGELAHVLTPDLVPVLDRLIEARRWDIAKEPFADMAAFDAYLQDTGGGLMWATAAALGSGAADVAQRLGAAAGLANLFLAVPGLLASGRKPLPDDSPKAILALANSGLQTWRLSGVDPELRIAALAGWRTAAILRRAAAEPEKVISGGLDLSEFSKRARLLTQVFLPILSR
jgi:phytoene/squalene synthetase